MQKSLYVLDLEGEVQWSLENIGSRPAVGGDGTVYVETWWTVMTTHHSVLTKPMAA
jgi:hypothetical protein